MLKQKNMPTTKLWKKSLSARKKIASQRKFEPPVGPKARTTTAMTTAETAATSASIVTKAATTTAATTTKIEKRKRGRPVGSKNSKKQDDKHFKSEILAM